MKLGRVLIALVAVAVVLGVLVASASARNYELSSQTFRTTFARFDLSGGIGAVECPVTMEGSFHTRTITKTVGSLIGYIREATIGGGCRRGSATILRETLPWHMRYAFFGGTLPRITSISLSVTGVAIRVREPTFGLTCLVSGSILRLTAAVDGTGTMTSHGWSGSWVGDCGLEVSVNATSSTVTVNNSATRITVRLI